jgi:aerobic carbon-monoxide dehydrogenase medium subunit
LFKFNYARPHTLKELITLAEKNGSEGRIMVGGTGLIQLMKKGLVSPQLIIDASHIPELGEIEPLAKGGVHIGATASHRLVLQHPLIREQYVVLKESLEVLGNARIRHVGTLGGNLCHADPAQDPPVALMALEANVQLQKGKRKRRLSVEDFIVGYYECALEEGEVLLGIDIPPLPKNSGQAFLKFTHRVYDDYATVEAGTVLWLQNGKFKKGSRIAIGGVGAKAFRARKAEEFLAGKPLSESNLHQAGELAAEDSTPVGDVRGSEEYKREMVKVFLKRALLLAQQRISV